MFCWNSPNRYFYNHQLLLERQQREGGAQGGPGVESFEDLKEASLLPSPLKSRSLLPRIRALVESEARREGLHALTLAEDYELIMAGVPVAFAAYGVSDETPTLLQFGPFVWAETDLVNAVRDRAEAEGIADYIVAVPEMESVHLGQQPEFSAFSMLSALPLAELDLCRHTFVDFGAGCGVLSTMALHQGVSSAVLIDNDSNELGHVREVMAANGYDEGLSYVTYDEDLTDTETVAELVDEATQGGPWTLACNIGTWPGQWTATNKIVGNVLARVQSRLSSIVLGGILRGTGYDCMREGQPGLIHATLAPLRAQGYEPIDREAFFFHPASRSIGMTSLVLHDPSRRR